MPKAVSYSRWSQATQGHGDSHRRQNDRELKYCEKHGLDLDETFVDPGVSAYRGKNRHEGALGNFIKQIDVGLILVGTYLLIESLDRLSREQVLIALELFTGIIRRGIKIVTLTNEIVFDVESLNANPALLMMSIVEMMRAHEESRLKGERVAAANANKRRRAREDRTPITALCPGWLRLVDGRFIVVTERAAVVRQIYLDAIAGLGKRRIADRLNRAKVPAFRGRYGWHSSSVAKILANEAVLGIFQPHRKVDGRRIPEGPPIPGYFPAVIDEATFWQAQEAMRGRRHRCAGRKGPENSNLFSGLGHCGCCGGSVVFVNKGDPPKGGKYLACSNARRGLCENRVHFPYLSLENRMLQIGSTSYRVLAPENQPKRSPAVARVAELEARLGRRIEARKRFITSFEEEDDAMIADQIRKLGVEVKQIGVELAEARKAAKLDEHGDLSSFRERYLEVQRRLYSTDPEERLLARASLSQEFRRNIDALTLGVDRQIVVAVNEKSHWTMREIELAADGKVAGVTINGARGVRIRLDGKLYAAMRSPWVDAENHLLVPLMDARPAWSEREILSTLWPQREHEDALRDVLALAVWRQTGPQTVEGRLAGDD